jgi:uncharacterized membrane protein
MAYCPNCGASVEGRFCAKCGTAMPAAGATAPPPPAYGAPSQGPPPPAYGAPPAAPAYSQPTAPPPPSYGPGPGAPPPPAYGMGAPPPPPGYGPPQGYPPQGPPYAQSGGMQENVAGTLCYALGWLTGIIFLVLAPYNQNRNIKFHAWQSIFFFGGVTIASIVLSIISGIMLTSLSLSLWSIFRLVIMVFDLGVLAAWIFLMIKAYNNQRLVLPIIGPLAEKQAYSS